MIQDYDHGNFNGSGEPFAVRPSDSLERKEQIVEAARIRASQYFPEGRLTCDMKPTPMIHQVGGHNSEVKPMLRISLSLSEHNHNLVKCKRNCNGTSSTNMYVLKPLNTDDMRGMREIAFYEAVQQALQDDNENDNGGGGNSSEIVKHNEMNSSKQNFKKPYNIQWRCTEQELRTLREFSSFLPDYLGVVNEIECDNNIRQNENGDTSYLILEDVTSRYRQPCVMDLKMGRRTYEPGASRKKIQSQTKKYPQQECFGFRIVGMNVYYDHDTDGYRKFGKKYGRSLQSESAVSEAFSTFFKVSEQRQQGVVKHDGVRSPENHSTVRTKLICNLLHDMSMLRQWFVQRNNELAFYASSIIIVYEGDDRSLCPQAYSFKLIDFAHVQNQSGGGRDWNYIHGLDVLIRIFDSMIGQRINTSASRVDEKNGLAD